MPRIRAPRAGRALFDRFSATLDVVDETRDVIEGRVTGPGVPDWCAGRGLDAFLLSLPDDALLCAEGAGLFAIVRELRDAPPALVDLCRRIEAVTTFDALAPSEGTRALRGAGDRKRGQVAALAELARSMSSGVRRVVDVGAGHGHLTRELASALGVEALGLERASVRVRRAEALARGTSARFLTWDAGTSALTLEPSDLVVALHACGELSDLVVPAIAEAGASALLVSCCLQKISSDARSALSTEGRRRGFELGREVLGLSNVTPRAVGVESSMTEIMRARETRHALRRLLEMRGLAIRPGEEGRGVNRRQMHRGLAHVARLALARRDAAPPTDDELDRASARARGELARMRRFDLLRSALGRVVEAAVVLDRALRLEEAGREVDVICAFAAAKSPRNLLVAAQSQDCAAR